MLYADELKAFEESGITELQVAFSREPGQPRTFVQQVIERERDHVWDLIEAGAVIYVCGNANTMAPGVRAALMEVYRAKTNGSDASRRSGSKGCGMPTATWRTSGGDGRCERIVARRPVAAAGIAAGFGAEASQTAALKSVRPRARVPWLVTSRRIRG